MSQTLAPTKHTNVKYSLKSGAIHKPKNMKSVNNTTLAATTSHILATTAQVTTAPVTTAPVTTAPVTTAPIPTTTAPTTPAPYIPFTGNDVSGSFWSNMSSWTSALFNATTMTIVFWILTIYTCFLLCSIVNIIRLLVIQLINPPINLSPSTINSNSNFLSPYLQLDNSKNVYVDFVSIAFI